MAKENNNKLVLFFVIMFIFSMLPRMIIETDIVFWNIVFRFQEILKSFLTILIAFSLFKNKEINKPKMTSLVILFVLLTYLPPFLFQLYVAF